MRVFGLIVSICCLIVIIMTSAYYYENSKWKLIGSEKIGHFQPNSNSICDWFKHEDTLKIRVKCHQ